MREISFRIWDKKEKTMFLSPIEIEHLGSWFDAHLSGAIADTGNKIVMQYTGLKDKNGKKIFEGDIVKCRWLAELGITEIDCEAVGVVDWQDDICMFYIDFTEPFVTHPCEDGRYAEEGMAIEKTVDGFTKNEFSVDYEIIGNIYKNPELLKWF